VTTTHTLRITIAQGEMTFANAIIVCSDNGGPKCAIPTSDGDCPDFIAALAEWKIRTDRKALTLEDVWDHIGFDCGGWWLDGDHFHPGPVGSGCKYSEFVDNAGDECLDLTDEVALGVPVTLGHLDYEDVLRVTPEIPDLPRLDNQVSAAEVKAAVAAMNCLWSGTWACFDNYPIPTWDDVAEILNAALAARSTGGTP
jgi:hypothetical protein